MRGAAMNSAERAFILLAGLTFLSPGLAPAAEPIPVKDFQKLHALIKPQKGEDQWAQIPWLTSLWEARTRAAAEGKPILLWEMDGHPLGCT
jgi:hypothetical protein